MITIKINVTLDEAATLCNVLAKGIRYYTDAYYRGTETVNPVWLWGLMNDVSKAVYERNVKEEDE